MIRHLYPITICIAVLVAPVTGFTGEPEASATSEPDAARKSMSTARKGFQPGNFGAPSNRVGGGTRGLTETGKDPAETKADAPEASNGSQMQAPSYPTSVDEQPLKY